MKAMILAAGYGTRLRPLTYLLPKPLFPVCNRPIVDYAVANLLAAGASEIVVNLHHLPAPIEQMLRSRTECRFHFSHEAAILGTGGGLRRVRSLLEGDDEFLLVNGDTIQDPPYDALIAARHDSGAAAALVLRHPPANDRFTPVWFDDGKVTGFGSGTGTGEPLMFAGAHAIGREVFARMPEREEFGIVEEIYAPLAAEGRLAAVVHDGPWFDVGTPQRYLDANAALCGSGSLLSDGIITGGVSRSVIGSGSDVAGQVVSSVVWRHCSIGAGVSLRECIVADGVHLEGDLELTRAIVCVDDPAIPRDAPYRFADGLVIAEF